MYKFLLLAILIVVLIIAVLLGFERSTSSARLETGTQSTEFANSHQINTNGTAEIARQTKDSWRDSIASQIDKFIAAKQFNRAVELINEVYQQASADDLEHFKQMVFRRGFELRQENELVSSIALFEAYAQSFNDAEAWVHLGNVAATAKDWDKTVTAYLKSSAQEYQPIAYEDSLQALIRASSHLRATLEKQDDQLGILALYQRLYDHHPNYPRFQLELAQSYLRLGKQGKARPLLELLQYDPELGPIAAQKLAKLNEPVLDQSSDNETQSNSDANTEVTIPLKRLGNSFILDLEVNSSGHAMLLDTGASITSLSSQLIRSLGLKPSGKTIWLNTANGRLNARLFRANKVELGPFQARNVLLAEIEFGRGSSIQGLVGTDLLNLFGNQHGYIIDDQKNALIFNTH